MKRMAQVIDGRTMSVGEILGGAAQDSNGAQLRFKPVKDSCPPVFEAKGTDNKIYSFEMTSYLSDYLLDLYHRYRQLEDNLPANQNVGCSRRHHAFVPL
jgi:hypothetical protein